MSNLFADWKCVVISEFNFYIYVSVPEIDPWLSISSHPLKVLAIFVFLQYLTCCLLLSIYTRLLVRSFHSVPFAVSLRFMKPSFFKLQQNFRSRRLVIPIKSVHEDSFWTNKCLVWQTVSRAVKFVQNGVKGSGEISSTPNH